MHLIVVLLTMLVLPVASILIERQMGDALAFWQLAGKWFVFWGAGVRLLTAGVRQIVMPRLTTEGIFGVTDKAVWPLAQELGFWNATIGALCVLTYWRPGWLPPLALAAAGFYAMAGIKHVFSAQRSFEANTAMISDLAMAAVLFTCWWTVWRNG